MPVASPTRYSSVSGSYRSSLSTSTSLDKPYYRTTQRTSYADSTTEYRSRYTEVDGKRERKTSLVEYTRSSRAPSVTDSDSGVSTRYRSDRSESRTRELSTTRSETNGRSKRATPSIGMSAAELYQKYSPSNYVPLTQRLQQQQNNYSEIARSKSISNDIGRPPLSDAKTLRKPRTSASTINERPERKYKEITPPPSYGKRNSMTNGVKDSNGNEVPSVSEIRRKFDHKMTVTKLPTNELRYSKPSVEQYLNQLKECENGSSGYTKLSKEDKPVPIHLPYTDKSLKWGSNSSSRSNSNSDISISKTISEPVLSKPIDRNGSMTTSLTSKLPSDRLASIKSQLDPNNPIGKILEKSTVITTENGDSEYKKRYSPDVKANLKSEIEKQVKAPKHTSNFASYIQISQPVASGATKKDPSDDINGKDKKKVIKYIDDEKSLLDNDIESPSGTGFENKTFEHENFLKKRSEKIDDGDAGLDQAKSMETSTDSTISDNTEEDSSETTARRKLDKDFDDNKGELAGGKSSSGLRRSTERETPSERDGRHEKSSQTSGLNGLRNIGNTCFMNSVVQCLSNTRPLLEYVVADRHVADTNTQLSPMKGALFAAFASMIKELWRSGERDAVVNTTTFKSQVQRFAPRFMGYSQQDAQEFLRYLLEGLHEDVNRVTVKPKPILTEIDDSLSDSAKAAESWSRYCRLEESRVSDIFVGQLKSTLRCTHCNHDSVTFDPFWDLSLPIPSRSGNLKLQQCLQHFTKEEEMDGDEKPTCSKCGVRRKCLKWFSIQKFPQVLVLHLKRFSPTERFRGKLSVLVEFPLCGLDMSPFAAARAHSVTYNLYAVSNHSGTTYSGHYTAYCKHPYTSDWHEYNDSRLSTIKPRDVVSPEAYVLFYERT